MMNNIAPENIDARVYALLVKACDLWVKNWTFTTPGIAEFRVEKDGSYFRSGIYWVGKGFDPKYTRPGRTKIDCVRAFALASGVMAPRYH